VKFVPLGVFGIKLVVVIQIKIGQEFFFEYDEAMTSFVRFLYLIIIISMNYSNCGVSKREREIFI